MPKNIRKREIPLWSWFTVIAYMIMVGIFIPSEIRGLLFTVGWFAIGGMCIFNYRKCGRVHCSITGPGFLAIGIAVLFAAFDVINIVDWMIWTAFTIVLVAGFGFEYKYRSKKGTCYR